MKLFKSKAGFTLIELLVVIGILAVLAAIAIPSVAGLIDRANVSADKTNANEMTNAVERFTSEYELYCQDIASGVIKDADSNGVPDDMDSAQGRVFNVTGAKTRADITALENAGLGTKKISRDTKYPLNDETLKAIVQNYTKTSSATFEPKQSDCHFFYSPDCGVVIVAEAGSNKETLNKLIISGMDAKGNALSNSTNWLDTTINAVVNADGSTTQNSVTPEPIGTFTIVHRRDNGTEISRQSYPFEIGSTWLSYRVSGGENFGYSEDSPPLEYLVNTNNAVEIYTAAGCLQTESGHFPKWCDEIVDGIVLLYIHP